MRTNIHFYFNFILFFLVFSAFGQPLNDNYANAIDVTSLINSCSSNAAYTTSGGTPDKIAGVYWNNSGPKYNVWFKFIAPATGQINATIDVGSGKGTQTKTQIAIWQADGLTEVTSKSNVVYGEDVSIGSLVLTPGNTYYISVDAFDASTLGSFTLCLQSTVDYDFYEGAIDVTSFINSCSPNAAYTTVGGTADKLAGSVWNNSGPRFNRWFKFTAPSTGQINITVDIGGVKGTQFRTQIAIWQLDGITQINSKRYAGNGEDVSIGAFGLTPGNTYYISVDSFDFSTMGSFTLCLQSTVDYDFYEGAIDVTSFINSCSPNASYTTVGGSPDKLAGSNWSIAPKYNRWFKFIAPSTGQINITVDIGSVNGTQTRTQLALWQSNGLSEIASQRYAGSNDDVKINYIGLIPGNTYYISVDSQSDTSWGTFTLCLQSTVDYDFYEGAIDVTSIINSCSANAIYATAGATPDRLAGSVWNNSGPRFNRWFKFTAPSTGQINVTVDIGGAKGTQSSTQIAIWQWDGVTQINSKRYAGIGEDVSIGAFGLTPGSTYYISVDTFNSSTIGSFTLCLQSTIDYDFYEGAIDVTSFINSCSPNASYTTVGGSPDKLAGSNWNNSGPKFNRWFKFTASTAYMNIIVDIGTVTGTQFYTQMALWQSDGITEIASQTYATSVNGPDVSVESSNLIPGNTYYISVDSRGDTSWGTFTLCLKEGIKAVDDTGIAINGFVGGTSISNILQNDKLNGNAIVASQVNLSFVSSTNSGITLSGTSVLVAAGTPQGTYTLTYSICDILNPLNCDQATVTINVTAPVINAVNDTYSPSCSTTGLIGNIFSNDTLNGASLMPNNVTVSIISGANPNISIDALTGNITITNDLYLNQYILVYSICENNNPSNCATATIQVNLNVTVWDGNFWSNGEPDSTKKVIFNGNYSSLNNIEVCSAQIVFGNVVINSGHNLIIQNDLKVNSGNLIFENDASLIQINNSINVGNITYKRNTSSIFNNYDFVYWGSPMSNHSLGSIWMGSNLADTFYSYNTINGWQIETATTNMIPGKGYITRARNGYNGFSIGSFWQGVFSGVPNNGEINLEVTTTGTNDENLISNPYPSTIDIEAFYNDNNSKLKANFYFWTHNTPITNNLYTTDDYAIYNAFLGAGVGTGYPAISGGQSPSRYVSAGQGFFTESYGSGGIITFKNSHRIAGHNNTFYRETINNNPAVPQIIENYKVWLNLSNDQGLFTQQLIAYAANTSNDFDEQYEAIINNQDSEIDFFSLIPNYKLKIQTKSLPFNNTDIVPLGFKVNIAGVYKISLDHFDPFFVDESIYLEDVYLNVIHDLNSGDYNFTTQPGLIDNRFILRYNNALSLDNNNFTSESVIIYKSNLNWVIDSGKTIIDSIKIFDMRGRLLLHNKNIQSTMTDFNLFLTNEPLIIEITSMEGVSIIKKIIN
jgi:hypothetical protein